MLKIISKEGITKSRAEGSRTDIIADCIVVSLNCARIVAENMNISTEAAELFIMQEIMKAGVDNAE